MEELRKQGIDPYPARCRREQTIGEAREREDKSVAVTGRLTSLRGHGKIVFANLVDENGKIQVAFKADLLSHDLFSLLELIDIGDFLSIQGKVGKTQAGEITVFAEDFQIITKSLRPLPDKWYGFKDVEERYRQRYVDLSVNPKVREIFITRTKVIKFLREFLDKDGFLEVETPILQPIYGGASAKPFITHHNVLDVNMFLRISDELYLKRLIVGGFEKVYEIGKDFRNEGIDREHNPEFTMLEFYWAYADYERLMEYTEKMVSSLVKEIKGSLKFSYQGVDLDFTPPWPRETYRDLMLKYTRIDIDKVDNEKKLLSEVKAKKLQVDFAGIVGYGAMLDALYKTYVRSNLVGPLFLTDRPTAFVALAKRLPQDSRKTASFQLVVATREIINAYNELNDPFDQAERWQESEKLGKRGQDVHEAFDTDYICVLEYGMPPTAGWGMGIDRLVAILTNQHTLKDVILFPTLRPKGGYTEKLVKKDWRREEMITREQALEFLHKNMKNNNLRKHCYAVEAVMRALAKHFNEDEDVWRIAGLIHDADYELTKSDSSRHVQTVVSWLKGMGVDEKIIKAVHAHGWKFVEGCPKPSNKLEWSLYCCDELTGLIVAVTLVRPDKKLSSVTVESVLKKWDNKTFAAGVNREQIKMCEERLGMKLSDFIGIALLAMQEISGELGL